VLDEDKQNNKDENVNIMLKESTICSLYNQLTKTRVIGLI